MYNYIFFLSSTLPSLSDLYEEHFLLKAGWVCISVVWRNGFHPRTGQHPVSVCGHHGNRVEPWENLASGPRGREAETPGPLPTCWELRGSCWQAIPSGLPGAQ